MYATYMSVLGNREDLFGDSPYVDKYITNPPADYDVNPEYLNDEKFAALITEAEKYLGYPYMWGGSNPCLLYTSRRSRRHSASQPPLTFCVIPVGMPPHFLKRFQISTLYAVVCSFFKSIWKSSM